jgi:hypothetical protein
LGIMKIAVALLASLAASTFATAARADEAQVQTATQLVVVTPNAPVVVTTGASPATSAPGATAPAAPMTASGAPANEDWANVSHINGQPVPVGQRNDYLTGPTATKRYNFAADPLTLLIGWIDVSASVRVSDHVALAAGFATLTLADVTGTAGSASAPIYFRRTFSGPYLEPGLVVMNFHDNHDGSDATVAGPQLMFGWQWMSDSGFNVALASGLARNLRSDGDVVVPQGYFRVGYAI